MRMPSRGSKGGVIGSMDAEGRRLSLRLRPIDGVLSAGQLAALADISRQHGMGLVQLLARNGVEIPGISYEDLKAVQATLDAAGLGAASAGVPGRTITVCTGHGKCPNGFLDTRILANSLGALMNGEGFPSQMRVAISGCTRGCTAPQTADVGFIGAVDPILDRAECVGCGECATACGEGALVMRRGLPRRDPQRCNYCGDCIAVCRPKALRPGRVGYMVYVGGRVGRRPQLGTELASFLVEDEAAEFAARVIGFLAERARPREQLTSVLHRVGIDALKAHVTSRPLSRPRSQETTA